MGNDDDDVERGKVIELQPLQEGLGESHDPGPFKPDTDSNFTSTLLALFAIFAIVYLRKDSSCTLSTL